MYRTMVRSTRVPPLHVSQLPIVVRRLISTSQDLHNWDVVISHQHLRHATSWLFRVRTCAVFSHETQFRVQKLHVSTFAQTKTHALTLICGQAPKCKCCVIIENDIATFFKEHNHPNEIKRVFMARVNKTLADFDFGTESVQSLAKRLHDVFIREMLNQGRSIRETFALVPKFKYLVKKGQKAEKNFYGRSARF